MALREDSLDSNPSSATFYCRLGVASLNLNFLICKMETHPGQVAQLVRVSSQYAHTRDNQ